MKQGMKVRASAPEMASQEHAAALRLRYIIPIIIFAALPLTFGWALNRDPQIIPSALIGQPVPQFALPPVKGRALGLSSGNLAGEVSLVNVFASWCVECRAEHPLLLQIKANAVVAIHGLNYKDAPDDAAKWLDTFGDPYTRTGADLKGRVGIDWGVYGVPETFVIAKDGRIAHKEIGPISPENWEGMLLPLIRRLQQQ
jgi:cytochrome c biogenesis protein CcmG/thiol:disulfide interchange protein DsbE